MRKHQAMRYNVARATLPVTARECRIRRGSYLILRCSAIQASHFSWRSPICAPTERSQAATRSLFLMMSWQS